MTSSKQHKTTKKTHTRRTDEFKAEALKLAEKTSFASAASQLGLHESQLYAWRTQRRQKETSSDAEQRQSTEIARLKRQLAEQAEELAILKKAAAYFAKQQK